VAQALRHFGVERLRLVAAPAAACIGGKAGCPGQSSWWVPAADFLAEGADTHRKLYRTWGEVPVERRRKRKGAPPLCCSMFAPGCNTDARDDEVAAAAAAAVHSSGSASDEDEEEEEEEEEEDVEAVISAQLRHCVRILPSEADADTGGFFFAMFEKLCNGVAPAPAAQPPPAAATPIAADAAHAAPEPPGTAVAEVARVESRRAYEPRDGDWRCPVGSCANMNFAYRRV
jgi:hypothetical protein